jgi:hypothetical protein
LKDRKCVGEAGSPLQNAKPFHLELSKYRKIKIWFPLKGRAGWQDPLQLVVASRFTNTRATRVSNRLFRIVEKIAMAGGDSRYVNPDGGAAPLGSAPQGIAGGVTPTGISVATNWTEEVALIGEKVAGVAIANVVNEALADLTEMHKNWLDIGLHTDGTGNLATLSAAPANRTANVSNGGLTDGTPTWKCRKIKIWFPLKGRADGRTHFS